MTAGAWLGRIRETRTHRWTGILLGMFVGVVLASVHWGGFLVGGALVGMVSRDLPRAIVAGVGFGLVSLGVWIAFLWRAGAIDAAFGMGQFSLIAVGIPLGLSILGSLVRGVV